MVRDQPTPQQPAPPARCGPLLVDYAARAVQVNDRPVALTRREYELLQFLMANPRRVYTRQALITVLWDDQPRVGTRTIDSQVRRVRAKLGPDVRDWIRTVRGVGYAFSPPVAAC